MRGDCIGGGARRAREQGGAAPGERIRRSADRHLSLAVDGQTSCPACLQPVSDEARQHVQESLAQHGGAAGADEQREVTAVRRRIAALEQFIGDANPQALRLEWDSIAQDERQIYAKGNEIKEIDAQIADVNEEAVRRTRSDLAMGGGALYGPQIIDALQSTVAAIAHWFRLIL